MWKLIIKNLWSRRKNNGWLMTELILVSIVTFIIIDPIVVLTHRLGKPKGYEPEQICLLELARLDENAPLFTTDDVEETNQVENLIRLKNKILAHPKVESTTILSWTYLNSQGNGSTGYSIDSATTVYPNYIQFFSEQRFFETYGIKSVSGSPSPEELSRITMGENGVIITKDLADLYFPGQNAVGKNLWSVSDEDTTFYPVYGVVEPISIYTIRGNSPVVFMSETKIHPGSVGNMLVRIKPEVDMDAFLADFRPWMIKELKAGNWFARAITPYNDFLNKYEYESGAANEIRLNIAYAVFFLINLCLGVIGTFWLQTRKRREEVGVMLSHGASPHVILRMLISEGIILTLVASLIGFILYFQYAWAEGLYTKWSSDWMKVFQHDWIHHFGTHFAGVSAIVLAILLIVVCIGVYIPGRSLSKVNPVDALRDE